MAESTLTKFRRDLHKIPELGFSLFKTNEYLMSVLEMLDCEITPVAEVGICAFFNRESSTTLAFRSDMDALPIKEVTGNFYSSNHEGKMHACGHDGHMAMLLGFAEYLNETKNLPHNVLLIFQPAEETTGGARPITATGILEKYNTIAVFGIHIWPNLGKGLIASKAGTMMSMASDVSVQISGRSAHVTKANEGIDALEAGILFISHVYKMRDALEKDGKSTVLKFGQFESGTMRNAISNKTMLYGSLRALSTEDFDLVVSKIREIAKHCEKEMGARFDVNFSQSYLPVTNDSELYSKIVRVLKDPEKNNNIEFQELSAPEFIDEDFSFYGKHAPSLFFFLGTGSGKPLHSNNFDFDEEILENGLLLYKTLVNSI